MRRPAVSSVALAPYAWVAWVTSLPEAQLLALTLMAAIEDPTCARQTLVALIEGWRRNAHRALASHGRTATVDDYLDVKVDARLYVYRLGRQEE